MNEKIRGYDAFQIYCAAMSLKNSLYLYCSSLDSEDSENVVASKSLFSDLASLRKTIRMMPEEIDELYMDKLADKIKAIGSSIRKISVITQIAKIVTYHLPELCMREDGSKHREFLLVSMAIKLSESHKSYIIESFSKFMMSIQPKEWIKNE